MSSNAEAVPQNKAVLLPLAVSAVLGIVLSQVNFLLLSFLLPLELILIIELLSVVVASTLLVDADSGALLFGAACFLAFTVFFFISRYVWFGRSPAEGLQGFFASPRTIGEIIGFPVASMLGAQMKRRRTR